MTVRLSVAMSEHLRALRNAGGPRCAYPRLSLATLSALERRGFVTAKRGLGSISMPHSSIQWQITQAGLAALAKAAS